MVATAIPKPVIESTTPRHQKRHYMDHFAREMESKIINPALEGATDKSTYKQEFLAGDRELTGITKITRQSRKIYDPTVAPLKELSTLERTAHPTTHPLMKDADSILYRTTYQIGYDKNMRSNIKLPRFHYEEYPSLKPTKKLVPSVYQTSYLNYNSMNLSNFNNPGKQFAISNFLYKAKTSGLTAKDIFLGLGKLKGETSYNRDYHQKDMPASSPPTKVTASTINSLLPKTGLPKI